MSAGARPFGRKDSPTSWRQWSPKVLSAPQHCGWGSGIPNRSGEEGTIVPDSLRPKLMYLCHDSKMRSHQGRDKVIVLIKGALMEARVFKAC
jgi:hypothetical protein